MREVLVDHQGLGDDRDDPHGPATRWARERVDRNDLRPERRRRAFAHRRVASVGASLGAGTIVEGALARTGAA